MVHRNKIAGTVAALLVTIASSASAGIPDCTLSTIPNVVACPDGTIPTTFTIVSTSGPLNAATVELRYTAIGEAAACWCPTQVHPIISGVTNASGQVTFNISGGGCLNPATIAGGVAIRVYVNNIACKEIGQVSPDVNSTTSPPCVVSLADAVDFTGPLSTSTYSFCFDLNSDNQVGLTDAVIFTSPASSAASCN
ncbi:MAG: hypothetical protein FD129_140 [bacterium]|nr:MAG: hypothetical protein FD129_140 [bacterium]